jgi:hypothetical protein
MGPIVVGLVAFVLSPTSTTSSEWPRLALGGYDPVAYFTAGRPTRGHQEFIYAWQNAMYQFASSTDRDMFMADPMHYAPQFAGYCVLGLSKGFKMEADPEAWTIVNDKLYFTNNKTFYQQLASDPALYIGKAEANWKKLSP